MAPCPTAPAAPSAVAEYTRPRSADPRRSLTGPRELAAMAAGSWMGPYRTQGEPPRVLCPDVAAAEGA